MLYSIQLLRGFAALLVVMTHIVNKEVQNGICNEYWFNMGGTGVDLFFIISGFIMCYTTHDKEVSFARFMKLRIERIIPLYWLFTTMALILYLLPLGIFSTNANNIRIFDSYLLLPLGKNYLVGTGWTLSYEFYFYFIFAAVLLLPIKSYFRYIYIFFIIGILAVIGWSITKHTFLTDFIFNHWLIEFAFGIFSFVFIKNVKIHPIGCIIMIICGLPILLYQNIDDSLLRSSYRVLYAGISMGLIFNGFLHLESFFKKPTNLFLSFLKQLGNSSYSLYLTHPFMLALVSRICMKLHLTSPVIFIFSILSASIVFGFFVYRFIEQPMLQWVRKRI